MALTALQGASKPPAKKRPSSATAASAAAAAAAAAAPAAAARRWSHRLETTQSRAPVYAEGSEGEDEFDFLEEKEEERPRAGKKGGKGDKQEAEAGKGAAQPERQADEVQCCGAEEGRARWEWQGGLGFSRVCYFVVNGV